MRRLLLAAATLLALASAPASAAVTPDEMLPDRAEEARARDLGRELRCLVCQNQSIDDSDAELADDLRRLVRERIVAGDSDAQVKAFLVARYGDFVLLKPPVRPVTWLLWFGPLAILGAGAVLLGGFLRRRPPRDESPAELTPDERARVEALLGGTGHRAP